MLFVVLSLFTVCKILKPPVRSLQHLLLLEVSAKFFEKGFIPSWSWLEWLSMYGILDRACKIIDCFCPLRELHADHRAGSHNHWLFFARSVNYLHITERARTIIDLKFCSVLVFKSLSFQMHICSVYTVGELKDLTLHRANLVKLPWLRAVSASQEWILSIVKWVHFF